MPRRSRYAPPPREQYSLFDLTVQLRDAERVEDLPNSIQELVESIGLDAAIDLVRACGGDELKIPLYTGRDSRVWAMLVESIGVEAAEQLVERYKGTTLAIAKCENALRAIRNRHYVTRVLAGEDFYTVRRESGLTRRHLYRLLAAATKRPAAR